jgi:hypothetical protein
VSPIPPFQTAGTVPFTLVCPSTGPSYSASCHDPEAGMLNRSLLFAAVIFFTVIAP